MRRSALFFLLPALLAAAAPVARDMTLTSADGFTLKGTLTVPPGPGRHPVVLLAPQFNATRAGWQPLVDRLTAKGIATLALDLRGHGQSTAKGGATVAVTDDFKASAQAVGFDRIPGDLALAAAWVRKQPGVDGRRLGLAGASLGAFAALLSGPETHPVVILALSPAGTGVFGANARLDLARAVERSRTAVMVMASKDDADAASNAAALKAIQGVYTRMADGDAHGLKYLETDSDLMAGFLGEYLIPFPAGRAR